jgi:hypothetical protein
VRMKPNAMETKPTRQRKGPMKSAIANMGFSFAHIDVFLKRLKYCWVVNLLLHPVSSLPYSRGY